MPLQVKTHAYHLIVTLLKVQGSSLKSTAAKVEAVVASHIEHPGAQNVLGHLHLTLGRAEAANGWKRTVENIAACISRDCLRRISISLHLRTQSSLPRILEDCTMFKLPQLENNAGQPLDPSNLSQKSRWMDRIDALFHVLEIMLS